MKRRRLSAKGARALLSYNKRKGTFRWRVNDKHKRYRRGQQAGSRHESGANVIRVEGRLYRSSHLAFLIIKGRWSRKQIDHKNRRNGDDRWTNLREATPLQNTYNRAAPRHSKTGVKGVVLTRSGRFHTRIVVRGRLILMGTYDTIAEAARVYRRAARKHHGRFACLKGSGGK